MATICDDVFVEEIRSVKKTAFGVAYLILKNTFDCEDAMSAAIVKAYEHRGKLQKRDSFRAWFLRILRNEAYTILRSRRKVFETDEIPESPQLFPDAAQSLDLRAALMRIKEDQRNALFLKQEGYSMEEIAAVLHVPVGTVKSRISRAKDSLRKILEENEHE
jgi:RNA polymerase sigma-70 factor (ECF subfamily)